ncbi:hypothetical protein N7520_007378 [Penicillium odoratum]|uniref:uncharacterized protein n=1 Tax=Penicillium odoratum TaxID=1167516 RepID=UPI0025467375|nr:uncharacterized protein N7520_007378 [Penicillium odoratum]KAJ5760222.1 hypothetical protein N7520_007378 [Penicillium odoratum]
MVDSDIHVEALAKFGDVIIVIQGESPEKTKRFMCDSRVLVQASIYFEKLFGPNFLEGPLVASSSIPEIPLHEDDPGVMGVILAILHYREPPTEFKEKSPTWLAMLAIHCDKYDCTKPLQSTMNAWLRYCQGQSPKTTDYGHLLLAAYLFRDESQFFNISRSAQINLRPGFALEWEKSECLIGLPDALERKLSFERNSENNLTLTR